MCQHKWSLAAAFGHGPLARQNEQIVEEVATCWSAGGAVWWLPHIRLSCACRHLLAARDTGSTNGWFLLEGRASATSETSK